MITFLVSPGVEELCQFNHSERPSFSEYFMTERVV